MVVASQQYYMLWLVAINLQLLDKIIDLAIFSFQAILMFGIDRNLRFNIPLGKVKWKGQIILKFIKKQQIGGQDMLIGLKEMYFLLA